MALPLLLTPVPTQSDSLHAQPKPTGQVVDFVLSHQFVKPSARPDYAKEVLAPLYLAQKKAAEEKAAAFKRDCENRGGHVEGDQCVVPPPPPVPSVPSVPVGSGWSVEQLKAIIVAAANSHGVSADMMIRIAGCESTYNPNARNRNYTAYANGVSYGNPVGMFQHVEGYWAGRASQYGYPGASVFDPVANANVTAAMMAAEGTGAWECK